MVGPIKGEIMKIKATLFSLTLFVFLLNADTLSYLKPSIYSVQLKTNGLFAVSALLPGTMMSLKKMFNSIDAYRITLGVNAGISNIKEGYDSELTLNNTQDTLSISLHVSYLRYLFSNRNMYLYAGVGPFGKYEYNTLKQISQTQTNNIYTIGIDAFPGLEWFIINHLSLLLEYDINIHYKYATYKPNFSGSNIQLPPERMQELKLEYNSVFIGLSIYL
jgi:hypothetical protein